MESSETRYRRESPRLIDPAASPVPAGGDEVATRLLPNLVVIGAMKCGTTALHGYLDRHPDVAMSEPKELNFFIGDERGCRKEEGESWHAGNWHRGLAWYEAHFPPAAVRGEASPGYTSPSFPYVAERMARSLPGARLVYMVRDPIERAVSQYRHHRAERTERRPPADALLDPHSQYLSRSRYHERLRPFLERFPRERILVCAQEELRRDHRRTLRALYRFVGADESFRCPQAARGPAEPIAIEPALRRRMAAELAADAARLRETVGREFPGWTV